MRRALCAGAAALAGLAACGPARQRLGDVTLRSSSVYGGFLTFGVEEGHIVSPELDASYDERGCVKGMLGSDLLHLCRQANAGEPAVAGNAVQRWSGSSGDFTLEVDPPGSALRMDGFVRRGIYSLPLMATVPFGRGRQWDELRRHPELLALAAALARVGYEPDRNDLTRPR